MAEHGDGLPARERSVAAHPEARQPPPECLIHVQPHAVGRERGTASASGNGGAARHVLVPVSRTAERSNTRAGANSARTGICRACCGPTRWPRGISASLRSAGTATDRAGSRAVLRSCIPSVVRGLRPCDAFFGHRTPLSHPSSASQRRAPRATLPERHHRMVAIGSSGVRDDWPRAAADDLPWRRLPVPCLQ